MSLIFRLSGKGLTSKLLSQESSRILNYVRPVTINSTPAVPPKHETHDERNMRLARPQSPHLTIYKPQLTSMLSISHRATGMVLAGYTVAFAMAAVYLQHPIEYYIEQIKLAQLGGGTVFGIKFLLAFPMTYHFWNGIRHLLWDTGKFFTIKEVYTTGWSMLAIAVASAIVLSGLS